MIGFCDGGTYSGTDKFVKSLKFSYFSSLFSTTFITHHHCSCFKITDKKKKTQKTSCEYFIPTSILFPSGGESINSSEEFCYLLERDFP